MAHPYAPDNPNRWRRLFLVALAVLTVLVGCTTPNPEPQPSTRLWIPSMPYIGDHTPSPHLVEVKQDPPPPAAPEQPNPTRAGWAPLVDPSTLLEGKAEFRGTDQWPLVANEGPFARYAPQHGLVSFYHEPQPLASGGRFNPNAMTAAHRSLPFGAIVRCTIRDTGHAVNVLINDRGPYIDGRILDLSRTAAQRLGILKRGIAPCRVEILAYPLLEVMGPKGNG